MQQKKQNVLELLLAAMINFKGKERKHYNFKTFFC